MQEVGNTSGVDRLGAQPVMLAPYVKRGWLDEGTRRSAFHTPAPIKCEQKKAPITGGLRLFVVDGVLIAGGAE